MFLNCLVMLEHNLFNTNQICSALSGAHQDILESSDFEYYNKVKVMKPLQVIQSRREHPAAHFQFVLNPS